MPSIPTVRPALLTFLSALLGGALGAALAFPLDLIAGMQAEIVGMVVGTILGSLLPRSPRPSHVQALIAAFSLMLLLALWPGYKNVLLEVGVGMVLITGVSSVLLHATLARLDPKLRHQRA